MFHLKISLNQLYYYKSRTICLILQSVNVYLIAIHRKGRESVIINCSKYGFSRKIKFKHNT